MVRPTCLRWAIFALALALAYLLGGFSNFFLRRPFVSDAVFSLVVMVTVAFVVINFFNKKAEPQAFATGVDWRLIPASVLVLFALWMLAGLALACSTRLDMIPTLAICSGLFLLGLMSQYLFSEKAQGRLVVGFRALHGDAELAAFLARRRLGNRQKRLLLGLRGARRLAYAVCYIGRGAGRGAHVV